MSDSDHVVLFDGETREIAREIVRCGGLDGRFTELIVAQEEMKTLSFGDVWEEYCRRCGKPADGQWLGQVQVYEQTVLGERV